MSRGYGRIQRAILEMFEKNPNQTAESFLIAGYIFETRSINSSQKNSTNRALKKLVEAGELEDLGCNRLGRKEYCLPSRIAGIMVPFCMTDIGKKLDKLTSDNNT